MAGHTLVLRGQQGQASGALLQVCSAGVRVFQSRWRTWSEAMSTPTKKITGPKEQAPAVPLEWGGSMDASLRPPGGRGQGLYGRAAAVEQAA